MSITDAHQAMATDAIQNFSWNYSRKDRNWILSQLNSVLLMYFASFTFSGLLVCLLFVCVDIYIPIHIMAHVKNVNTIFIKFCSVMK